MTIYADIRAALEGRIASVSGVPSAANRAWENVKFSPTTGTAWVRMQLVPISRRPLDVTATGLQRHDGLFVVDVFVPSGKGPSAADTLADAICTAFEAGTVLTANSQTVQIEYAEIDRAAVSDPPWYQAMVSVKWKAFA